MRDETSSKRRKQPKGDYAVGYARPPEASRFQAGRSGNPKGRPKKNATLAGALEAALGKTQTVRMNGREMRMTPAEVIAMQLTKQAMEGKLSAIAHLLKREPVVLERVLAAMPASAFGARNPIDGDVDGAYDAGTSDDQPLSATDRAMMALYLAQHAGSDDPAAIDELTGEGAQSDDDASSLSKNDSEDGEPDDDEAFRDEENAA